MTVSWPRSLNFLRGAIFLVFSLLWVILSSVILLGPLGFFIVLAKRFQHLSPIFPMIERFCFLLTSKFIGLAFVFPTALVEIFGSRIRIFAKPSTTAILMNSSASRLSSSSSLLLSNHPTTADWLFIFSLMHRFPHFSLSAMKITMKHPLKSLPFLGWALQQGGNLFLYRQWKLDQWKIQKCLDYYRTRHFPVDFLLFPEGTDFGNPIGRENSNRYAQENHLPLYQQVLHPRTTGFLEMYKKSIEKSTSSSSSMVSSHGKGHPSTSFEGIFDITIGFPDFRLEKIDSLVKGKFPEEIHFYVEYFPYPQEFPATDSSASSSSSSTSSSSSSSPSSDPMDIWLRERFRLKNDRLENFYQKKSFLTGETENNRKSKNSTEGIEEIPFRWNSLANLQLYAGFFGWLAFLLFILSSLWSSTGFFLYFLSFSLFYILITHFFHGMDEILFWGFSKEKAEKQE